MSAILNECELVFKNTRREFEQLLAVVQEKRQRGERLDEVEHELMQLLLKVGKAALEDVVAAAGDGDAGETLIVDEMEVGRLKEKRTRTYRSIFGPLAISRYVYARGKKQKQLAAPLDAELGLPAAETSYVLEKWMVSLATHLPYDSAAKWLAETLGIGAGGTTIENRVRALDDYAQSFRAEIEDELTAAEGELIIVQADGKGVPIRTPWEQRVEETLGRKPHLRHRKRDYERSGRRPMRGDQAKTQQATAGACYSIERHGRSTETALNRHTQDDAPRPQNKRLWAEMSQIRQRQVSRGAERVFQQLAAHVAQRDPQGNRQVVCISDGAVTLWKLKQQYFPQAVSIIDIFHVTEKLWAVAHCIERDGSKAAEDRVTTWLGMLLDGKVDHLRGVFQRMLNQRKWPAAKGQSLQHAIDYLKNNRHAMQYHDYLKKGYPIGSGVIEGACKHVIGDRFCNSGMRWELDGAQPLLHLRTIHLSNRWDPFIQHRITREQQSLYQQFNTPA